jgi:hypothetical protein
MITLKCPQIQMCCYVYRVLTNKASESCLVNQEQLFVPYSVVHFLYCETIKKCFPFKYLLVRMTTDRAALSPNLIVLSVKMVLLVVACITQTSTTHFSPLTSSCESLKYLGEEASPGTSHSSLSLHLRKDFLLSQQLCAYCVLHLQ